MAILICSCDHPFQDKKHGRKRRVMNPLGPGKANEFRCTVCGKTKTGDARTLAAVNNKNGEDK
jgi:hypothetical protein